MALLKPPTDSGTAEIADVESLVDSKDVNMNNLKSLDFMKTRLDRLVLAGNNLTMAPMVEVNGAREALTAHPTMFRSFLALTPMEERMLALEKAFKKNLEQLVRRRFHSWHRQWEDNPPTPQSSHRQRPQR